MAAALLTQGKTAIQAALKTLVSHIAVSDDTAAFVVSQVAINPTVGATSTHVEASSEADVTITTTNDAFDATITIDGTTEFTNKSIFTIGICKGLGIRSGAGTGTHTGAGNTTGTDTLSRSVRTLGIGVQAGDTFTIGVRVHVQDNS